MPDSSSRTSRGAREAAPAGGSAVAEAPVAQAEAGPPPGRPRSLWTDAWQDLRRKPTFLVSAGMIVLLLLIAAFPGLFTSADPRAADYAGAYLQQPQLTSFFSAEWLGYDHHGRSIYARVLYGTRASVVIGIAVTTIVLVLGSLVGMVAGYFGGWIDAVVSRIVDTFMGIPFLLGAMVILVSFDVRGTLVVILALAVLGWTTVARVMRGSVISVKQSDYVQAARSLGAGTWRILLRHILPNAMAPVIVVAMVALGGYISAEATLSYLGIGLVDPALSWGGDINSGKDQIRVALHVLIFPSIMLSATILAFLMMGDAVRDALDPKLR